MDIMTPGTIEAIIAEFKHNNLALAHRTAVFLDAVCQRASQHSHFMNTLSMMEHIGSQKIMATQYGATVDQPTLKHLAEETRHAFFLKRQAEKSALRNLTYLPDDVMASAAARMYFRRLEAIIRKTLSGAGCATAIYLYMSMIVEFRAVWGYSLYQTALSRAGNNFSLKSLLAEEEVHLADMATRLHDLGMFSLIHIREFCAQEQRSFKRLLQVLELDLRAAA